MDKEDVVQIYNGIPLSHKKEQKNVIFSNMDGLETVILSEASQTEKDNYHMILFICGIKKNGTNEPIYKTEVESEM